MNEQRREETDACPACGSPPSRYGCITHEQAGTFCRAPEAPKPHLRATDRGIAIVTHGPPPKKRGPTFEFPPSAPRVPCRSCRADVVWIVTEGGRRMPVDPGTKESHFATCPHAADWRKKR